MILIDNIPIQLVFNQLQSNIQSGCLIMIPLFMLIKMGLIIIKGFVSSGPIHYNSFFPAIILWIFIASYGNLIKEIEQLADYIVNIVTKPVDNPIVAINKIMNEASVAHQGIFKNSINQSFEKIKSGKIGSGIEEFVSAEIGSRLQELKQNGIDFFGSMVSIFASIARMFIETVRTILLKFLIIIGPLALTFSLNEGFGHIGKFWLQKLFSVYCWSLTLNILDHIIIDYYRQVTISNITTNPLESQGDWTGVPIFMDQLIVGFMYTLVPWLTSLYLGGFNSGHFLGNTFRVFTSLVTSTISSIHSATKK
jgi:hypothetical protein